MPCGKPPNGCDQDQEGRHSHSTRSCIEDMLDHASALAGKDADKEEQANHGKPLLPRLL